MTVNTLSGPYVSIESYVVSAGGDDIIEYGETVYLTVTLENVGSDPATNVNMTLSVSDAYITLTDDSESFGTIAAGASVTRTNAYTFTVSNTVPDAHAFELDGAITSTQDNWNDDMHFTAYAPVLSIQGVSVADGDNGRLDPDETADIVVTIENSGGATANNINAILSTMDSYITINDNSDTIGSFAASATEIVTFNVTTDNATPIGHTAAFDVDMTADLGYTANDNFSLTIGLTLEDFETGDFSSYPWEFGGNADWSVVTESPQEGVYCTKSGDISDSQTSELVLEAEVTTDGTISFYRKVSSESNYDYLKFFIDDAEQDAWSGEVAWSEVSYPVTTGNRTFKWQYFKDGSVDNGSDCAWIDYIIFPAIYFPEPADITVTPLSFEKTLEPGGSSSDNLTIGNAGEMTLEYTATVSYVDPETENIVYADKKVSSFQRSKTPISSRNRTLVTIGAGSSVSTSTSDTPFGTFYHDGQNQYLFTASELSTAGLVAGDINAVGWNVASAAAQVMNGFNIGLKHTIATSVTGFETGFANCYSGTWTASAGWNDISFSTPFTWDGTSNLLVKICFDNTSYTSNSSCYIDTYTAMNGWAYNDGTTGCSDPWEGTIDTRPQTRFDYTSGPTLNWLTLNGGSSVIGSIDSGSSDDVITVGFDTVPDGLAEGTYEAEITITSNDPDESPFIVPVTLTVSNQENYPDWEIVTYPNNTATIYGTVSILGYDAEPGDLVGAFVGAECRGMGEIQIARTAYITMLINVAENGEIADFKVYDYSADTVYNANYSTEINIGETIGSYPDDLQEIDVLGTLDVPQNVTITTTPDGPNVDVFISWTAVPGATSYTVYRASDPNAVFPGEWTSETGIIGTTWNYTTDRTKRFYRVSANN